MAHAVADEPQGHMGLPLPHGKLAMWLFLVTEIMFFTGLIGTYILLRSGTPSAYEPWPTPHDVHPPRQGAARTHRQGTGTRGACFVGRRHRLDRVPQGREDHPGQGPKRKGRGR